MQKSDIFMKRAFLRTVYFSRYTSYNSLIMAMLKDRIVSDIRPFTLRYNL